MGELKKEERRSDGEMAAAEKMAVAGMREAFVLCEMVEGAGGEARDLRFLDANPSFLRLTGLRAEEVVGRLATEVVTNGREWAEWGEEVVRTGLPKTMEDQHGVSGRRFEVTGFRPGSGQLGCLIREVTAERAAEEAARRERARYEALVGAAEDGYAVLDDSGRILRVNEAHCRMLGYEEEELVGLEACRLEGGETKGDMGARLRELRETGRARFETQMVRKDGGLVDVEVSSVALESEREVLSFIRDIGGRKRMEAEREATVRLLGLLNEPLGEEELVGRLEEMLREWSGCEEVEVGLGVEGVVRWREGLAGEKGAFLRQAAGSIRMALERRAAQAEVKKSEERFRAIADYTVNWENWYDSERRLQWVNPAVERLTGYTPEECRAMEGYPLCLVHEEDLELAREVFRTAKEGSGGAELELRMRHKSGEWRWYTVAWQPVVGTEGRQLGHRSSIRDISARKRERSVLEARVNLTEFARTHTLAELLEEVINEAERLTGSRIGFYHFLEDGEQTVLLQAWSTRTRKEMCRVTEGGTHYEIGSAGVWVDAVRERRAVIHNDYARLAHRKGMPEGHAEVRRELVAPAFRGQRIVALLGVGNKETDYDERDAEVVSKLADFAWDTVEWKRTEEALAASERNYRELVERLPLGTMVERDGRVAYVNGEAVRILGADREELLGQGLERFVGSVEGNGTVREGRWKRADGRAIDVEWATARVQYEGREARHVVFRDITHTKLLEQQFIQAQKMESLGRLAGGVAHDFNNLLTVINGYCELLLSSKKPLKDGRMAVEQIQLAGERAERLVAQMLAFSRKQMLKPEALKAGEVIEGVSRMLARLLGEDIELRVERGEGGTRVRADRTQLEQVLLNLAVNARDAMPEGGTLTIRTEAVEVAERECERCGGRFEPGRYVRIGVEDTGVGMSGETMSHLFEPFFTTKGPGKGTGLGLAMVHGTVMQCGGHVDVESRPGEGARFEIYLPALEEEGAELEARAEEEERGGRERVLLVEDQEGVREYATEVLRGLGYEVEAVADPVEALEAGRVGEYALLATDVVMPRMSGAELARRLRGERPELKVLFISGYAGDELERGRGDGAGERFLAKPFSPGELGRAVRQLLDGA